MANDKNDRRPYVNPVKCLNNEGGHYYEHKLGVNISSTNVDPTTGALVGEIKKEYVLELVCRDCMDRKPLYRKTVDFSENVSLAQMLTEYKADLAAKYYAEHPEQNPSQSMGSR